MKSGAGLAIAAISALAFGAAMKRKKSVSGSVGMLPAKIASGFKRRAALIVLLPSCGGPDPIQKQKASLQTVVEESGINYDCIYGICLNDAVESVRFNGEKLTFDSEGVSYIDANDGRDLTVIECGGRIVQLRVSSLAASLSGDHDESKKAVSNQNIFHIMVADGWQGEWRVKDKEDKFTSSGGYLAISHENHLRDAQHPSIKGVREVELSNTQYFTKDGGEHVGFWVTLMAGTRHPELVKLCDPGAAAVLKVMPLSPASPIKPQTPGEAQAELERRARAEEAKIELERRAELKEVQLEIERRQRRAERRRAELQALKSEPQ